MCLIQIVIFLFAASLSMMNDWSQRSGVINGSTLAPLHGLLILLLYYSYNPAGCFALPTSRFLGGGRDCFLETRFMEKGSVAFSYHSKTSCLAFVNIYKYSPPPPFFFFFQ